MEQYLAFLRGINVNGKNRIEMKSLKENMIALGYSNVMTFLNSGNIIFSSNKKNHESQIAKMIKDCFHLTIPVFVLPINQLKEMLKESPHWWGNDNSDFYHNVIFILKLFTNKVIKKELGTINCAVEQEKEYGNHMIFWSFDRKNYTKSFWWKKSATFELKDFITIRTDKTIKKLVELASN